MNELEKIKKLNLKNTTYPAFLDQKDCDLTSNLGMFYYESIDRYWELVRSLDKSKLWIITLKIQKNAYALSKWLDAHPIDEYWESLFLFKGLIKAINSVKYEY